MERIVETKMAKPITLATAGMIRIEREVESSLLREYVDDYEVSLKFHGADQSTTTAFHRTMITHGRSWRSQVIIRKCIGPVPGIMLEERIGTLPVHISNKLQTAMIARAQTTSKRCLGCFTLAYGYEPVPDEKNKHEIDRRWCMNCTLCYSIAVLGHCRPPRGRLHVTEVSTSDIVWHLPKWLLRYIESEKSSIMKRDEWQPKFTRDLPLTQLTFQHCLVLDGRVICGSKYTEEHSRFTPWATGAPTFLYDVGIGIGALPTTTILSPGPFPPSFLAAIAPASELASSMLTEARKTDKDRLRHVLTACPRRVFDIENLAVVNADNCVGCTACRYEAEKQGIPGIVKITRRKNVRRLRFGTNNYSDPIRLLSYANEVLLRKLIAFDAALSSLLLLA